MATLLSLSGTRTITQTQTHPMNTLQPDTLCMSCIVEKNFLNVFGANRVGALMISVGHCIWLLQLTLCDKIWPVSFHVKLE